MYYNVCPYCGDHLDPGERCDCKDQQALRMEELREAMEYDSKNGQYRFRLPEKKAG